MFCLRYIHILQYSNVNHSEHGDDDDGGSSDDDTCTEHRRRYGDIVDMCNKQIKWISSLLLQIYVKYEKNSQIWPYFVLSLSLSPLCVCVCACVLRIASVALTMRNVNCDRLCTLFKRRIFPIHVHTWFAIPFFSCTYASGMQIEMFYLCKREIVKHVFTYVVNVVVDDLCTPKCLYFRTFVDRCHTLDYNMDSIHIDGDAGH